MIKILIDFKRATVRSRGRSGGLRGALGGNIRGVINANDALKFETWPTSRLNLDFERQIETKTTKIAYTSDT